MPVVEDFVKRQNDHQTHFESLVLLGPGGLEELDDKIESALEELEDKSSGKLNLTTKIDGAPAVFIWSEYPGLPDNSISLKSFTKDTAANNCISSPDQVDQKYPDDDRANFREILKYCLQIAPLIPKGECWQGDCLFTKGSKHEENILGKDYITFQPNKIIYAFSEENPGYEQVKNADFGICFHTIYRGPEKKQSFKVDASKLNVPDNIYIMSPALKYDKQKFNVSSIKSWVNKLNGLEVRLLANDSYEDLTTNEAFEKFRKDYWSTFENNQTSDKKSATIDETTFLNDFREWIKTKRLGKLKDNAGAKARANAEADIAQLLEIVDNNKDLLKLIVLTFNVAAHIKMLLWEGFKQSDSDYSTFYKSRTKGYFHGEMEGVAMSDQDGNIVKLVDRTNFSSYNRDPDIMSGFEHESLKEDLDPNTTLVFSFGKMNPPTIGHQKLVQAMASSNQSSIKPKLYLSHSYGYNKKDPLKSQPLHYESKINWCKKAFGSLVDVISSDAKTALQALHEINEQYPEIKNLVLAGGEDRIGGDEDIFGLISKYNGYENSRPNEKYHFNSITPLMAGNRSEASDSLVEQASSTMVRKCVLENNEELFEQLVPFSGGDAEDLFEEIRDFYKDNGVLNEALLMEAPFKTNEISKHNFKYLDKVSDDYVDNKEIKYSNGEAHKATEFNSATDLPAIDKELDSIKDLNSDTERVKEFNDITGLTWTKIYKGNYSGYSGDKAGGPGIGAEKDSMSDARKTELEKLLVPYMENKYGKISSLVLTEPKHLGGANSKRNVSIDDLFTIKDLYKGVESGPSTSDKIADVMYTAVINGKYKEPIYLSIKEGPTVSPINLGINKVQPDVIINAITTNITKKENELMNAILSLRTTTAKGIALVSPNGEKLTNWYYRLPENELNADNYKNAIINSYGNNYFYYHIINGKLADFRPVSSIINELSSESVTGASLTITPARFVIQFNLGEFNCRLFFRRKGSTTMFLLTEVKKGKAFIEFKGTQVDDISNFKFEMIKG